MHQAFARVISELLLYGEGDLQKFRDGHPEFRDLVQVKSRFPENTVTVVPSGFDHSIPGTTVQFIMKMVLIAGGVTVMEDRKKGILARMLFSPLWTGEVFEAKLLGRWLMGLMQALMLIVVGKIFFRLNLGSFPLAVLLLAVFALAMAALNKLTFFPGGFCDILPHPGILLALSIVLTAMAGKCFKIGDYNTAEKPPRKSFQRAILFFWSLP